jgi:hypothetical protein
MVLFDKVERTFTGPSNHNEDSYGYYVRSARPDIGVIRNLLNTWFAGYPDREKPALKNAFRKQFDESFFELFVYSLFKNLGFEIEIHPSLAHSTKRPDFHMSIHKFQSYVEATVTKNKTRLAKHNLGLTGNFVV